MSNKGYALLITKKPPEDFHFPLESFLSERSEGFNWYQWVKKDKVLASLSLVIEEQSAISLPQSPFGGFRVHEPLHSETIQNFLDAVLHDLKEKKVHNFRITQAPRPYEEQSDMIDYLLFKSGFRADSILNHQFYIGKKKIKNWVKEKGGKIAKKTKSQGLKSEFAPIRNFEFLGKIREWNRSRGYDESIDQNAIIQQVSLFPERYFEISIRKDGRLVGAALAVSLTPDSVYYFKSAIDPSCEIKHGGDILVHELFLLAASLKLNFIDLGSSDKELEANHQLIFFKSRFSNDQNNKITWSREV